MTPMSIRFMKPKDALEYMRELEGKLSILEADTHSLEICVLEGGMDSGKPSVAIVFKPLDGSDQHVMMQTSAQLIVSMARMIVARHPELNTD